MFRKLLLIVAFVAVGAGAYGVARAYFNTEKQAPSSVLTAGTISIDLAKNDANSSASVALDNWMPGDTAWVAYDVKNTSTVPVTLSGHVDGLWNVAVGGEYDRLVNIVDAQYYDGGWKTLNANSHGSFTYADFGSTDLKALPVGATVTMRMQALFNTAAENDYQGKIYTANVFVTAHQVGESVVLPAE